MDNQYFVYIVASKRNGTIYIDVTGNLQKRIWEHRQKIVEGFIKKYDVDQLVYFEQVSDVRSALLRENQMKKWKRGWKLRLIEKENPQWRDLYSDL